MALNRRTGMIAGGALAAMAGVTVTMFMVLGGPSVINTRTGVNYGDNLQQAVNDAIGGDTITITADSPIFANLTLPNKSGSEYITIQSDRAGELPVGQRINPAAKVSKDSEETQSNLLAKLRRTPAQVAEPVIKTASGAHHYKFIGVEISTEKDTDVVYDLVRLGGGRQEQKTLDQVPHHITFDRSYIHGFDLQEVQRGMSVNSGETTISNSYISNIHGRGYDTQAIGGWNGPGPFHIINNYLEAAGENIMFGGADAASEELSPSNIEILGNLISKPMSWKKGDPSFVPLPPKADTPDHWTVKNLLELKNAKNITIIGNFFANNWTDGQSGIPILFTVRNQECTNKFATVQNIVFSLNIIQNAEGGVNFLGKDNEAEPSYIDPETGRPKCGDPGESFGSIRGTNATLSQNLFRDIRGPFLLLSGFTSVALDRNTHVQRGNLITFYSKNELCNGFKYTNNLTVDHDYGIVGDEIGNGVTALNHYTPGWVFTGNTIIKPYDHGNGYPTGNNYSETLTIPADWRSPVAGVGADIDKLLAAQAGAGPQPTPSPSPSATATVTISPSPISSPSASPSASSTPVPTATPLTPSANNTRLPPTSQIVDSSLNVWTMSSNVMLKSGVDSGGRGSQIVWFNGGIYAIGTDTNWWKYSGGTAWERVAGDPAAPISTPTPTSTPTAVPTATPSPTAQPSPSATVAPCALTVPASVSIPRFGSRSVTVSLSQGGAITATALSGQVTVSPRTRAVTSANPSAMFQLTLKNNASSVRFDSPCGSKTTQVMVAR